MAHFLVPNFTKPAPCVAPKPAPLLRARGPRARAPASIGRRDSYSMGWEKSTVTRPPA